MRNRAAERAGIRPLNINMNPLVVPSQLSEEVDLFLGHFKCLAPIAELFANRGVDGIYVVKSHARKASACPLNNSYCSRPNYLLIQCSQ